MKEFISPENGIYCRVNEFQSERPTLVFIHGLSGSSSAWREYEERFEQKYNILTFDLRGHGVSQKFREYKDYKIEKFVEDIEILMTFLQIKKCILVSHSFGTLIALEFLRHHQDRLISAIFLSPNFAARKIRFAIFAQFLISGFLKTVDSIAFFPRRGTHIDYSKYRNTGDWNIRRMWADIGNTNLRIYLYCIKQFYKSDFDNESFLENIRIPVLIVHGKKDTIFPAKYSVETVKEIKNAQLILLPNANHILVLNNFSQISEAIENFVKRVE